MHRFAHLFYPFHAAARSSRIIWLGIIVVALTACGELGPTAADPQPHRFDHVATVEIDGATDRAALESAYGARVIVFRPEAGFAVLGFDRSENNLSLLAVADDNLNAFNAPEATAGGWTAWSGGWTAWSGGWTAWSGGWTAWSGGTGNPSTFGENLPLWDNIDLPEAQALSSKNGEGTVIAVIDTGVDLDHPAFTCATLDKRGDCVSALSAPSTWADFVDGDTLPDEVPGTAYGHGTGVAGVLLQVAPAATILPIRALGPDGSGDVAWVVQAIDHAIAQGAHIINLSLGTDGPVASLRSVLTAAADLGIYVVVSAGNEGQGQPTYPAALGRDASNLGVHIISVASVGETDIKSGFSNYGNGIDLTAPGELIHTLVPDAQRGVWSGTSFSTPIAAGSLALLLSLPKQDRLFHIEPGTMLPASGDDITAKNPGYQGQLGLGRLNSHVFLQNTTK